MSEKMKREGIENARRNGGVPLSLKEGSFTLERMDLVYTR